MLDEKRAIERESCQIDAAIRLDANARQIDCVIENISENGAKVRFASSDTLPPAFTLLVPLVAEHYEEKAVELRWQIGTMAGVRFRAVG